MLITTKPCILFHIIEDKKYHVKDFSIQLSFCGFKKINYKNKIIIDEKLSRNREINLRQIFFWV